MIKVIYDHQVFSFQQYGGVSRYFYELAKRMENFSGFSASIAAPLHVNRYLPDGGAAVHGRLAPLDPHLRRFVGIANRCVTPGLLKCLRPSVVHETYYRKSTSAPKGCPVVTTVHDMIHEKFEANFTAADQTSDRKRFAVSRADRVICVSEKTRADLIELFGTDPQKTKTIHHGFSLCTTAEPEMRPDLPKPFFLYVGQRAGHKNFAALLRAYASSGLLRPDFDLIAFGGNAFARPENDAIRAAGLNSNQVRHLGGDDGLLAHLYRRAIALVYPSLYEGFGIPPLEAMSLGCPVLCSNTSSIPEVVGNAGLYFDPTRVEAIRDAMESTISSPGLRSDLIALGGHRAKMFSYDRCAAETANVYRDVVQ
jgi:glycosyltransferase involved in cell wall biosynthesis